MKHINKFYEILILLKIKVNYFKYIKFEVN